jgi:hypothetical protein
MTNADVLRELAALRELNTYGVQDEKTKVVSEVPYNFTANTRMKFMRRIQRLERVEKAYQEVRNVYIKKHDVEGMPLTSPDPRMAAYHKEHEELLAAEAQVPAQIWEEKEFNLSKNPIPVSVLAILIAPESDEAKAEEQGNWPLCAAEEQDDES